MKNSIFIKELLTKVKQNKKYSSLSDEIVLTEIKNYIKSHSQLKMEKAVKEIRAKLHKAYSSFQTKKKNKIMVYLKELENKINNAQDIIEITKKILSINISAKERIDYYEIIYKKIFNITGKPKTISDFGCGFNPFSFPFMHLENIKYYAYDIDEEDVSILNDYFKIMKNKELDGSAEILDLRNFEKISLIPDLDIVFLFKTVDILDVKNHKISEELIKILKNKTKFIAVSFATKTITRKKMNFPNRNWFELMLERNNLRFQKIEIPNEIFYVIG